MNIYCCCGSGLGSSLILKMSVEEALETLDAAGSDVQFGQASSIPVSCDLVLCSDELAPNLYCEQPVYGVHDLMDEEEIASILQRFMEEGG
ncbi:PTS sugar transporter subunit IIB [uncultured Dubosiella sp.]|uniref:PTS sugar transporter subunit IIB n=1 Tax=uncultured Dubosiella sp. TaxID=1937011 RepID=UPI0027309518|nr:PTS sugar transporter subunit IIB [uncultured Dubosiella sp.]